MGGRAAGGGPTAPRWLSAPLVRRSRSADLAASRAESRGQAVKLSGEAIIAQQRCGVGLLGSSRGARSGKLARRGARAN
uniref:Uncharacterized protein n=1 Tax=Oryza meridionalis TaxID=40149 RepID=A0A0E0DBR6_9ORYZ